MIEEVRSAIGEQSLALARAADSVLNRPEAIAPRFTPISTAEAVLIYAGDFIPSWAGAISIDLIPGVIVFIMIIVQSAIRAHEDPLPVEDTMTLKELQTAMTALRRIEAERDIRPAAPASEPALKPPAEPAEPPEKNIARFPSEADHEPRRS